MLGLKSGADIIIIAKVAVTEISAAQMNEQSWFCTERCFICTIFRPTQIFGNSLRLFQLIGMERWSSLSAVLRVPKLLAASANFSQHTAHTHTAHFALSAATACKFAIWRRASQSSFLAGDERERQVVGRVVCLRLLLLYRTKSFQQTLCGGGVVILSISCCGEWLMFEISFKAWKQHW